MQRWMSQLRKGLVEFCVIGAMGDSEAYGYQVVQRLAAAEGLAVSESTVYPILARLTKDKLVSVRAANSPSGPPRRYYRLTQDGHTRLAEMGAHWTGICGAIDALVKGDGHGRQELEPTEKGRRRLAPTLMKSSNG